MLFLLEVVAPVFAILGLGFAATKLGWFSDRSTQGLLRFVNDYAIPALLFHSIATTAIPDRWPWGLWGSFFIAAGVIYAIGIVFGRGPFGRSFSGATITGMGCCFGNTVLLGIPIAWRALGDEGMLPVFLIIGAHSLVLMTATTVLLEVGKSENKSLAGLPLQVLLGVIKNPIMMGVLAGIIWNFSGLSIPGAANEILVILKGAVTPCALFALGATLSQYGVKGRLAQSAIVLSLKLLIMPLAVWLLAAQVFDLSPLWVAAAVLLAAQPTGINMYLFAARYETGQAIASTTIFLSAIGSLITLPLVLWFLGLGH